MLSSSGKIYAIVICPDMRIRILTGEIKGSVKNLDNVTMNIVQLSDSRTIWLLPEVCFKTKEELINKLLESSDT